MKEVILRPKTEDARAILEQFGDVWRVAVTDPDPVYGSVKRLMLDSRSDMRSKSMWVRSDYDELFEVYEN